MSNEKNRSAFPASVDSTTGLTKREYFAAMAMQGLMAVPDKGNASRSLDELLKNAASLSVQLADALLTELEKSNS